MLLKTDIINLWQRFCVSGDERSDLKSLAKEFQDEFCQTKNLSLNNYSSSDLSDWSGEEDESSGDDSDKENRPNQAESIPSSSGHFPQCLQPQNFSAFYLEICKIGFQTHIVHIQLPFTWLLVFCLIFFQLPFG